jgi:hypothetical protein
MGLFNGIFFGIFQMSQVIGNIIGAVVLANKKSDDSTQFLFYIFLSVAGVGVLILCLLRPEHHSNPSADTESETRPLKDGEEGPSQNSLKERILSVLLLLKDWRMVLMIPPIFYSGLEMGFLAGDFTSSASRIQLGNRGLDMLWPHLVL